MAVDDKYTVSLLHFDGGITDESGKVWTPANGAAASAGQVKFGEGSLYLNGSNQYITAEKSTDFEFGAGDFTIDWWEYRTANTSGASSICRDGKITPGYQPYLLGYASSDNVYYYMSTNGSSWDIANAVLMGKIIINKWVHYAICRQGTSLFAFQNGSLISKTSIGYVTLPESSGLFTVGLYAGTSYFPGYIDELKVSKGIARWTSEFSPPSVPYSVNPPSNLTAVADAAKINLSWSVVAGATGYNVKRATKAGGPYTTIASNVSTNSYSDASIVDSNIYYYIVTAVNQYSESCNSNEVSAFHDLQALLRVTMIDSSERKYKLLLSEVDNFVNWFNRYGVISTNYVFDNTVDGGKEYLSFSKIISFEAIPSNEQILLRVTMSDSSEKEYKVSIAESDQFIKGYNRTLGSNSTCYVFNKEIDGSKEYLFFDKIISFQVIPLTK